jgi:hypothetical protein
MGVFRKLMNFVLLANGVSAPGERDASDEKWRKFRAEREAWERAQREKADDQTSSETISNRSTSTNP